MPSRDVPWPRLMVALCVAGVAACGDSGSTAARIPSVAVATSPSVQTAAVGSPVPQAPAVRVTDDRGQPVSGVVVTFATSDGSIEGAVATTDATGSASSARWTLGGTAGPQRATATIAQITDPVVFTATATAGTPASVSRAGGDGQSATVGTAAADSLSVRVSDAFGNPVPNAAVTFTLSQGSGTLSAGTAATGVQGIARVRLTLGTRPEPLTVTATVAGAGSVTFSVTAKAGPPAGLSWSGDVQTARVGTAVPVRPSVTVRDLYGNVLAGVAVAFAVTRGGGTLSAAAAATDAAGVATSGTWTLGPAAGENVVTATVAGIPTVAEFRATATDNCAPVAAYPSGTAFIDGVLTTSDCRLANGEYVDHYSLVLSANTHIGLWEQTARLIGPNPKLYLYDAAGTLRAFAGIASGQSTILSAVLPAGTFRVGASLTGSVTTGEYRVSRTSFSAVSQCFPVWVVNGSATQQSLDSTDCTRTESGGTFYSNRYTVYLRSGETLIATQRSTSVNGFLLLRNAVGGVIATDDQGGGGNDARLSYRASTEGVYTIEASTAQASQLGTYTMTVEVQ